LIAKYESSGDSTDADAFVSVGAEIATIAPTDSSAIADASAVLTAAGLPSEVTSVWGSVINQEIVIQSSVLNNGALAASAAATTQGSGSATEAAGTTLGTQVSSSSAAPASTSSGSGAEPTAVVAKVAGLAVGILGAAIALM
jgi:hypothetical protein